MGSWSASERLLQHLEASQGLGMALETYRVRVERAIQPQKSLPESRRVAPGTSRGHFFEAWWRDFHEKTSTNLRFRQFLMFFAAGVVFQDFGINVSSIVGENAAKKKVLVQSIASFSNLANL